MDPNNLSLLARSCAYNEVMHLESLLQKRPTWLASLPDSEFLNIDDWTISDVYPLFPPYSLPQAIGAALRGAEMGLQRAPQKGARQSPMRTIKLFCAWPVSASFGYRFIDPIPVPIIMLVQFGFVVSVERLWRIFRRPLNGPTRQVDENLRLFPTDSFNPLR
jgi:hypothetical protein